MQLSAIDACYWQIASLFQYQITYNMNNDASCCILIMFVGIRPVEKLGTICPTSTYESQKHYYFVTLWAPVRPNS